MSTREQTFSTQEQKFYRNEGQNVQHNEYKYEFMEGVVGLWWHLGVVMVSQKY